MVPDKWCYENDSAADNNEKHLIQRIPPYEDPTQKDDEHANGDAVKDVGLEEKGQL